MMRSHHTEARVPRYTSYPTAPHFGTDVTPSVAGDWLNAAPKDVPLSLYFHIPFCDSLCWFCGCHTRVVNHYGPIKSYVDLLLCEIDLVAASLGSDRVVSHIHFGGGSPTMLGTDDIARLEEAIHRHFLVRPDAEFAVEIDPRGLKQETIEAFAKAGANRASIGMQDVNPIVQRAVNRWQPISVTREAVARLRDAGIAAINIDLMYGLPHQTVADVRRTVDRAVELLPQRLAVFGYAHVPHMKRHQNLIDVTALPDADERLDQYEAGSARLIAHDYRPIGLDHFALPGDPLAVAQRSGTLARNFQGYTTDRAGALLGFGASAISSLPQGYLQNAIAISDYRRSIIKRELATARGRFLTSEDRFRRDIIERLMCDLYVDLDELCTRHGRKSDSLRPELRVLTELASAGLIVIDGNCLQIPERMRAGVRLVCAVFDTYLASGGARHTAAV